MVHTPRIGGESDIEDTDANDIELAARYNYIGESFDVGVLAASEDDSNQVFGRDYFATRLQYKNNTSRFGILRTFTKRPSAAREATVSVLDFHIEVIDEVRVNGQWIDTEVESNFTVFSDRGWWLSAEWEPSDEQSHEFYYFDYGQFMDVSDFGFVERVNRQQFNYEGSNQWTDFKSNIRDLELAWYLETKNNEQNHDLPNYYSFSLTTTFNSTRAIEVEYEQQNSGIDDLITRGNNPVYFPELYKFSFNYSSKQNYDFTYEVGMALGSDFLNGRRSELEFEPSWQNF